MGKRNKETALFHDRGERSQNTTGNLVNPAVVKTINILDTSKAIILSNGIIPSKSKASTSQSIKSAPPPPPPQIKPVQVQSQNLLRYHLVGDCGWKTVFGYKTNTNVQPINIIKDSKINSLVVSSPDGIIPKCIIKIHCTSNEETQIITVCIKEEIRDPCILFPGDSNPLVEWSQNVTFVKGSSLAIRIEEENNLDLELYLQ